VVRVGLVAKFAHHQRIISVLGQPLGRVGSTRPCGPRRLAKYHRFTFNRHFGFHFQAGLRQKRLRDDDALRIATFMKAFILPDVITVLLRTFGSVNHF
jgi:hypothetical protein